MHARTHAHTHTNAHTHTQFLTAFTRQVMMDWAWSVDISWKKRKQSWHRGYKHHCCQQLRILSGCNCWVLTNLRSFDMMIYIVWQWKIIYHFIFYCVVRSHPLQQFLSLLDEAFHSRRRQEICMEATQTNMDERERDTKWDNSKQKKDKTNSTVTWMWFGFEKTWPDQDIT